MLVKYGDNIGIDASNIEPTEKVLSDPYITDNFSKLAKDLKKIAPKADEFLYFHAIFMHAAEASLIDMKTGEPIKDITGSFDKDYKWTGSVFPYGNSNADVFPEQELKKAYKGFIGRGLFVNHQSHDSEKIRGIIIDAVYNDKFKRVEGLVALDKKQYPELARQVQLGYNTGVSMGTQVQTSICTLCGNKATKASEFCNHVKFSKGKLIDGIRVAEINVGLTPIELSIVSVPADSNAKIRMIVANLNEYAQKQIGKLTQNPTDSSKEDALEIQSLVDKLSNKLDQLDKKPESVSNDDGRFDSIFAELNQIKQQLESLSKSNINSTVSQRHLGGHNMNEARLRRRAQQRRVGYFQGTEEPKVYEKENADSIRDKEDKQMAGQGMEPGSDGLHPGYKSYGDEKKFKEMLQRAEDQMLKRRLQRQGYFQGTDETKVYDKEDSDSIRDKEDKQMVGQGLEPGSEGVHPGYESYGDEKKFKEMLQRAHMKARLVYAYDEEGKINRRKSHWDVYADDKLILTATGEQIFEDKIDEEWNYLNSKEYGNNLLEAIRNDGFGFVRWALLGEDKKSNKPEVKKAEDDMAYQDKSPAADLPKGDDTSTDELLEELKEPMGEADEQMEKDINMKADITSKLDSIIEELSSIKDLVATHEEEEIELAGGEPKEEGEEKKDFDEFAPLASIRQQIVEFVKGANDLADDICEVSEVALNRNLEKDVRAQALEVLNKLHSDAEKFVTKTSEFMNEHFEDVEDPAVKALKDAGFSEDALSLQAAKKKKPAKKMKKSKKDKKEDKKEEKKEDKKDESMEDKKASSGREWRNLVAKKMESLKVSDKLKEAHPKGGTELGGLDSKTKEKRVEDLVERHDQMMDATTSKPMGKQAADGAMDEIKKTKEDADKQKKAAEEAEKQMKQLETKMKETQKAAGDNKDTKTAAETKEDKGDAESAKYYNELWKDSDQAAKEFAKGLTESFSATKKKADFETDKLKMRRAYNIALELQEKGFIPEGREAVSRQAEEIMSFDDKAFESYQRTVAGLNPVKKVVVASSSNCALDVGLEERPESVRPVSLAEQLSSLFTVKGR